MDATTPMKHTFSPVRPGLHSNGEWTIHKLKRGWQLYGCTVKLFDGHGAHNYTMGPAWPYLKDAKDHALYRMSMAGCL